MINLKENTALLLIDAQQGFDDPKWGKRNNPDAEANIEKLARQFRLRNKLIFHVQHLSENPSSPLRPGQVGVNFKSVAEPAPGERIFQKRVHSAFIGTNLEEVLRLNAIERLVIVGIAADHCVSTTTRMAADLGFQVFLPTDATYAFARKAFDGKVYEPELVHAIQLASLHQEFATVLGTDAVIDALGPTP